MILDVAHRGQEAEGEGQGGQAKEGITEGRKGEKYPRL
jgi:hypothetical protein